MKTFTPEWVEELQRQTKEHMMYWQLNQQMQLLEPKFEQWRSTLEPEERQLLDAYLSLQKRLEVSLTNVAYSIGLAHGQKKTPKSP